MLTFTTTKEKQKLRTSETRSAFLERTKGPVSKALFRRGLNRGARYIERQLTIYCNDNTQSSFCETSFCERVISRFDEALEISLIDYSTSPIANLHLSLPIPWRQAVWKQFFVCSPFVVCARSGSGSDTPTLISGDDDETTLHVWKCMHECVETFMCALRERGI